MEEVTVLELEAKGECLAFSVEVHPGALHIPGTIQAETLVKKAFKVQGNLFVKIVDFVRAIPLKCMGGWEI